MICTLHLHESSPFAIVGVSDYEDFSNTLYLDPFISQIKVLFFSFLDCFLIIGQHKIVKTWNNNVKFALKLKYASFSFFFHQCLITFNCLIMTSHSRTKVIPTQIYLYPLLHYLCTGLIIFHYSLFWQIQRVGGKWEASERRGIVLWMH